MATEVRVPAQGNDIEECVIGEIYVSIGDEVHNGQAVFVIETAKAAYDVPADSSGTVLAILADSGQEVPVHSAIVILGAAGEGWEAPSEAAVQATTDSGRDRADVDEPPDIRTSPKARVLARRRGIDLSAISGSGPRGRILASDVLRAGRTRQVTPQQVFYEAPTPIAEPTAAFTTTPLSAVRRVTAERMSASLQHSAQFTLMSVVDAGPLQAVRARVKSTDLRWGLNRVSITDLVCFAVIRTLAFHPGLNSHFSWEGITRFDEVNLGIAVDTPRGLLVPTIPAASGLRLGELSARVTDAVTQAREGSLTNAQMAGATFTVSSLGASGVTYFTPVINPPEVAILGVGAIAPAAIDTPAGPMLAPALHLSLTVDHRAVDGAPAAAFLAELGTALRHLDTLIAL